MALLLRLSPTSELQRGKDKEQAVSPDDKSEKELLSSPFYKVFIHSMATWLHTPHRGRYLGAGKVCVKAASGRRCGDKPGFACWPFP